MEDTEQLSNSLRSLLTLNRRKFTEQIFCRVNVSRALRRSLASNFLRTGIHYRCANGCVTEQPEREPMVCRNASLWREHVLVVGNINDCKMRSFHGSPYARMGFGAKRTNPVPLSFNHPKSSANTPRPCLFLIWVDCFEGIKLIKVDWVTIIPYRG